MLFSRHSLQTHLRANLVPRVFSFSSYGGGILENSEKTLGRGCFRTIQAFAEPRQYKIAEFSPKRNKLSYTCMLVSKGLRVKKREKWRLIYLYLLFCGIIDLTPIGRTMTWTLIFFFVNLTLFLTRLWAFVEFSNLFIYLCVYDIRSTLWLLTEIQLRTSQPPFSEIKVFLERVFDSYL